jgi:class 3 adenylate cyclase/tetratricopeptide (TPR) repeat protein
MNCPRCQIENPPSALFCNECGTRLESPCSNCGEPNRRTAKYCRNCGQTLNQTRPPSPVATGPAPGQYVPKHLADKIRASQHTLEGERKQVTVLFADIRGSTKLVEGLDPEEAQKIIDPVLHVMMDAVHRYEGTVNQVLGDGIMALFGAPLAHEDHALRACYAALAMQEEMRHHRQKLGQSEESGLQIGIGMNTGEVVVRSIDNDLNIEYSALGQTTHLAARMEELSPAGRTLLTASTLREVEGFIQVRVLGPMQAKGISHAVEAFELHGTTSARTRVQAGVSRGLTPFVGRAAEVEMFQNLVRQTSTGHGQVLALVGEPGMGKSRLVYEFTHFHVPTGWLVLEGASASYGKATPYFPLIELLRRYYLIAESDDVESIQQKVLMQVLELGSALRDTIPSILALLSVLPQEKIPSAKQIHGIAQFPDVVEACDRFNAMEPQQRRRQTLDALKRLFVRESQKQPLILVFEDLHWIDNETQAFLDGLIDGLPLARILLLADYRPGYTHAWGDKSYYAQLRVDPLRSANAEELLQHLLGRHKDLAPLKQLLIERTEGNPFFAEESVRSLVETGILVGDKGAYKPGLKIDAIKMPSTVQNVVADRIDRLPTDEKHLLQNAAVIGVVVPMYLLRAVSDLPESDLQRIVAHLQAAEFIYESNLFPEIEYSFRHALTSEVAYGALLRDRRAYLHARTVSAFELIAGNAPHDQLEKLAHHAYHGELWEKAAKYQAKAGAKALDRSANREAVLFFDRALESSRRLPQNTQNLQSFIDLLLDLRNALFLTGDFGRILNSLNEAQTAAESLNDLRRLRRVWNAQLSYFSLTGDPNRVIDIGKRALSPTMSCADPGMDLVTNFYLGINHHIMGNYHEAMTVLKRLVAALDQTAYRYERFGTSTVLSVSCRYWLVQNFAQTGIFGEGIATANDGVSIAEEANHPYSKAYMICSLGFLLLIKGELDRAIAAFDQSMKICKEGEIRALFPQIESCLGFAYALTGRQDQALKLLEEADSESVSIGRVAGRSLRIAWHGECHLLFDRRDQARQLADAALKLSTRHGEQGHRAWALRLRGMLAACLNPPDFREAENDYTSALALAQDLGMRPLEGHCHLGLGHGYRQNGQPVLARGEVLKAIDIFREIDMDYWLAKAESSLNDVHGANNRS